MPKNAQFYLLSDASPALSNLSAVESLACNLAASAWRLGKRVLLACENEAQALNIDEALWQREPDEFVPHNLSGEATTYATPIEISWTGKRNAQSRDLLINLQPQLPEFINSFNQIIDFVPAEEQQKALARERYKQLRQLGWELSTEQAGI
ncbi:DNA polymerase III subunit chi [Aggregatibacter actinomycetemcomitans serotype e str. SC1083]|uniref:DNA polymerase III subunit chi n=1 Tax=Aggregatibacter actinomycetemcomitans serotype e str. SC1083 TaxID=907488 RepID=G4AAK5_AGGAC|nr:DNA polymerase III subunit chi [Aggregatibacter actinomycetemcomitans]EGY32862.1 DNA polymerase III subunit chi [Aggregatibacter actinomycetemcomitans serotype e str. SC1083]KYK75953.1 DNA polymerase III subunit chi [Aggregatibacter actinomycetemcomitans serotype e str. SA3096]KYK82090.1 DNA polymerase III subunit chi [Aggregatibacter actinomycetemcomitans serotype e str. SC936]KYK93053.1 DNA polymerase III subunit chi [Aggregatibacter actinomycetemcomitans serotype e str. ANH9776]TYB21883.